MDEEEIDTTNRFLVSVAGDDTFMLLAPPLRSMTRAEALNLAAWLSVLADPMGDDFKAVRRAVANT